VDGRGLGLWRDPHPAHLQPGPDGHAEVAPVKPGGADGRSCRRELELHLRHSFGTTMASAGAPMRSIMDWMGHADFATTLVYADHMPDPTNGAAWAARAFGSGTNLGKGGAWI
jgi:Phage integrase family